MLIETHMHLGYPVFAKDFDDVLLRATEADGTRIITIGTSVDSSRRAVGVITRENVDMHLAAIHMIGKEGYKQAVIAHDS